MESEEEELETLRKLEELLELLVDKELRLSLWLLELELWLLRLTLGELEELLWLKIDEDIELEEDEVVVENFRLERAKNSQKLRPYLSHSKLRKIIRQIDSNRDRKKALWK